MKKHILYLGIIILATFSSNISAQNANAVQITSGGIEGFYRIAGAEGWSATETSLTEIAVFADDKDGCTDITNVANKIAFVTSIGCEYGTKALNAQTADAVACIVCNTDPLTGILRMTPGEDGGAVTIPVYGMSFNDCQKIRDAFGTQDFAITLTQNCETEPDPSILWGTENGEGDFSNGLGEWFVISEGDTSWYWTDDPVMPGAFTEERAAGLITPRAYEGTACNGYMLFPSDYYDNEGDPANANAEIFCDGSNPDPNGTQFCVGSLYSPLIDLSGQNIEGLFCRFYHDVGYYYGGATSLIASYDGGITWPDTVYVTSADRSEANNAEIYSSNGCEVLSASVNDRFEGYYSIPLQEYNGEDVIQLQFKHYGGYYHATIDDVTLIDASYVDMNVGRSFVARNGAEQIPLSQAQQIPFHIDLNNLGNLPATEVSVKAELVAPDGSVEWQTVNDTYVDYPPYCFINENNTFLETFTPTQLGQYTALYTSTTPRDGVAANDTVSFSFTMSETKWQSCPKPEADDNGNYNHMWEGLIIDNPIIDYAIGYPFYTPNGEGHVLSEVRFGINFNANNSGDVKIYVFEWNPGAAGQPGDGSSTFVSEELTPVGCMGEDTFGQARNGQAMNSAIGDQSDITVPIASIGPNGQPEFDADGNLTTLCLKDDQQYLIVFVIDVTAGDTEEFEMHFISEDSPAGSKHDVSATNFAFGQLGIPQRYGGTWQDPLLNNGAYEDLLITNWDFGYRGSNMPWIEMEIEESSFDCTVGTEDLNTETTASVSVFPNPVTEFINVELAMGDQASDVFLELSDVNGKLVAIEKHEHIKRKIITMDVTNLQNGIYTLNVRSELGFTSRKIVVAK